MPDDKNKKKLDRTRISVHEPYELKYWAKRFGVTPARIKAIVAKVGTSVKKVKAELE
jgi:hypothetical protein